MLETPVDPHFALTHARGTRSAHNIYLGALAELGACGAALLAAILIAHGRAARRAQRRIRTGDGLEARLGVALVAVFAAILLIGGTLDLLNTKLPWMLLALIHSTALQAPGRAA
jgi:O-antigen ligase